VADLFLFQCYTGLAYAELQAFDPMVHLVEQHDMTWLMINRHKSGSGTILPFFPEARAILEKYGNWLPVITNQKYNSYLKEVGEICGIEKYLTTHIARKTFATLKLNAGYSIEAVSKMVGHKNISITQTHYATPGMERILNEYRKMAV
jgi:integrase